MGLAVALGVHDFVVGLPAHAGTRIRRGQRRLAQRLRREHAAIAQIAVVADRQYLNARFALVAFEFTPEIPGVHAVPRRERPCTRHALGTIPEQEDAMQVVAVDHRGHS